MALIGWISDQGRIQIFDKGDCQEFAACFKKGGGRKKFGIQRRNEQRILE